MISSLRGHVLHLDPDSVIVDVAGVGYLVAVTPGLAREFHVGDETVLHTSLIVREDALSLVGFRDRDELGVFTQLIGVSGVGPKSALGVLAALTVTQIAEAVDAEDDAPFRKVSGIGPKTAKLIIVQLAGKLIAPARAAGPAQSASGSGIAEQVVTALVGLGWSDRVSREAVAQLTITAQDTVSSVLKRALSTLGPARKEQSGV